jgi:hypothetical protein
MVLNHVTCMFKAVELWIKFYTSIIVFCNYVFKYDGIELCVSYYVTICV